LAQFDRAYRFMLFPVKNLTWVISSVMHPILSKKQDDQEQIYLTYLKIVKPLSLMGVFFTAFCFWSSQEIIVLVFGSQWYEAVDYFRWLSLSIWAQMVASSAGAIYMSIGNTKLMFLSGLVHGSISVLVIVIGVLSGDLIVFTICISVGFIIKFFVEYLFLVKKGFKKKMSSFLYKFIPDTVIFAVLFMGLFLFSRLMSTTDFSLFLSLVMKLVLGIILYFACLFFTGQWKHVKGIIRREKS